MALTSMLIPVVRARASAWAARPGLPSRRRRPSDHGPRTTGPQIAGRQSDGRALGERYVVAFRSKSMNSAASSGLANMMVRSSSWIMRP